MGEIIDLIAREIFDSRGNPTGETEDTFIADRAVACHTGFIRTGSPARSECVAKYNRLLQIAKDVAKSAHYRGQRDFTHLPS